MTHDPRFLDPRLFVAPRTNPLLENIPVDKKDIEKNFSLAIQLYTFENFLQENFLTLEKINSDPFLKENTLERYRKYFSSKLLDSFGQMLRYYVETTEKTTCTPSEVEEFNEIIQSLCNFEASLIETSLQRFMPEKLTRGSSHTTQHTRGRVKQSLNRTHKKK